MITDITYIKNVPTLVVIEDDVTCTLKLDINGHETITKGDDVNHLAKKIGHSYRMSVGKQCSGVKFLKLIEDDLHFRTKYKLYMGG